MFVASLIAPAATSPSSTRSYSARSLKYCGGPVIGHLSQLSVRKLPYPVSSPIQYGLLHVRASKVDKWTRARFITCTARSGSSMPTWTWAPKIISSRVRYW